MSLNVTTSSATTATSQVASSQTSESTKKSSADSSFKNEMEKVTTKENKKDTSTADTEKKAFQKTSQDEKQVSSAKVNSKSAQDRTQTADDLKYKTLSMIDVNNNLVNDIENMMNTNAMGNFGNSVLQNLLSPVNDPDFGNLFSLDYTDNVFVSESDAEFFINLAQNNNDVTAQAVTAQAQLALENGAELSQVQQNVKISETLLNAINIARENNQPLRIDFDQNVAVILRFGKDGSFAANFIPGDKVVEQYLKNNLDSLKSTFDEKDIPYTDLSYSNRGSKHQKEQQRSQQQ